MNPQPGNQPPKKKGLSNRRGLFGEQSFFFVLLEYGAESRTRTDDLLITNQLLYQLSYFGLLFDCIVVPVSGKVQP